MQATTRYKQGSTRPSAGQAVREMPGNRASLPAIISQDQAIRVALPSVFRGRPQDFVHHEGPLVPNSRPTPQRFSGGLRSLGGLLKLVL